MNLKQLKTCNICKKHSVKLTEGRCKKCYEDLKQVENEMFKRAKGMSIRIFDKRGELH